jgi:hypothetical protein
MCKELTVILVNRVVAKKRIIGQNGGSRRRRGTRGMAVFSKRTIVFFVTDQTPCLKFSSCKLLT